MMKVEHQRIDAFELWCWRRLLRVPWTARRSNQSILKETSPGCSLEALMLKLKLPILWPPHAKSWLIGKDPNAGRDWGQGRAAIHGVAKSWTWLERLNWTECLVEGLIFKFWDNIIVKHNALCLLHLRAGGSRGLRKEEVVLFLVSRGEHKLTWV